MEHASDFVLAINGTKTEHLINSRRPQVVKTLNTDQDGFEEFKYLELELLNLDLILGSDNSITAQNKIENEIRLNPSVWRVFEKLQRLELKLELLVRIII